MVTVHLEPSTKEALQQLKLIPREPYNDVIKRLISNNGDTHGSKEK